MVMVAERLAVEIKNALGDADQPVSSQNTALADSIITELSQFGKVNFASGTITGTTAPGTLTAGAGLGGMILGLDKTRLAKYFAAKLGVAPTIQIEDMADGITTHIMTGTVNFKVGTITGTTTSSPTNPGNAEGGGSGGKIFGLDGEAMAMLIAPGEGGTVSEKLKAQCDAIVRYIMKNADITLPSGSVTGVAPAGGGPLGAGTATGGTIK